MRRSSLDLVAKARACERASLNSQRLVIPVLRASRGRVVFAQDLERCLGRRGMGRLRMRRSLGEVAHQLLVQCNVIPNLRSWAIRIISLLLLILLWHTMRRRTRLVLLLLLLGNVPFCFSQPILRLGGMIV